MVGTSGTSINSDSALADSAKPGRRRRSFGSAGGGKLEGAGRVAFGLFHMNLFFSHILGRIVPTESYVSEGWHNHQAECVSFLRSWSETNKSLVVLIASYIPKGAARVCPRRHWKLPNPREAQAAPVLRRMEPGSPEWPVVICNMIDTLQMVYNIAENGWKLMNICSYLDQHCDFAMKHADSPLRYVKEPDGTYEIIEVPWWLNHDLDCQCCMRMWSSFVQGLFFPSKNSKKVVSLLPYSWT